MWTRDASLKELLDDASCDDQALSDNLADIRRINALLGWTAFTSREVLHQVSQLGLREAALLDVAAGSADIPLTIARQAAKRGLRLHVTVTDLSQQIVRIAVARAAAYDTVRVEQQDALALPYPAGHFTVAMCTLALHHFDPADAVKLLSELSRVSRRVLVFDVVRSRAAYYGAWFMTRALRMHPMTRHDAPISVLRAYSAAELRELAHAAGLHSATVRLTFPFRLVLIADGEGAPPPLTARATGDAHDG